MGTNRFDIWHIAIPVADLDASVKFYTSLGLSLVGTDEYPSKKQAFVATRPGGFNIELFQPKTNGSDRRLPDHLAFDCDDLSAFRDSISAKFEGLPSIEEFDNGVKYLGLKDPDGVSIEFFEGRKIYEQSITRA